MPPPSLLRSPIPPLSPWLLFLSRPPPSPPSPTLQTHPILSPPSLLLTIPPSSPPPPRSPPPPPPPLPHCNRPPSLSLPRLRPTPPRHSHSCPPLPPLPMTPSQRQSARTHLQTPLFLHHPPHVSQVFRAKCQLNLCSPNLVNRSRVNQLPAEIMCPVIKVQQHLSIQMSFPQILLQLPLSPSTTKINHQLPACNAPLLLMVLPHHLSSPLSLHTCKICLYQTCLRALPTLPCIYQI